MHAIYTLNIRTEGSGVSSGDGKRCFSSGDELKKPVLFYLILVGLALFFMSVIIHVNLSGEIGWNTFNINYVESFITEITAIIGLSLFMVSVLLFAFVNRLSLVETQPQE